MSYGHKYTLNKKDTKKFLEKISEIKLDFDSNFMNKKTRVDVLEMSANEKILFIDDKVFIEFKNNIFPALTNKEVLENMPSIIVDKGAVPHICDGADIMAPGVLRINKNFEKEYLVTIVEENFNKKIALAKALFSSEETSNIKSGKVAKNIHFIGDKFWKILREIF